MIDVVQVVIGLAVLAATNFVIIVIYIFRSESKRTIFENLIQKDIALLYEYHDKDSNALQDLKKIFWEKTNQSTHDHAKLDKDIEKAFTILKGQRDTILNIHKTLRINAGLEEPDRHET